MCGGGRRGWGSPKFSLIIFDEALILFENNELLLELLNFCLNNWGESGRISESSYSWKLISSPPYWGLVEECVESVNRETTVTSI